MVSFSNSVFLSYNAIHLRPVVALMELGGYVEVMHVCGGYTACQAICNEIFVLDPGVFCFLPPSMKQL